MFPTPNVGRSPVDRGYLLPDEPEGHPLRCVSFLIPDTIEYRAALYRQVYNLGVTETWDRTDAHKAMLAAEVWTGALQGSFTVFEDDCPVITQIRPDPSGCGNLEQSTDGGATWTDIPGTDFLPRNGLCEMTGGLEITPTADVQPAITITMPAARTNKLMQWNVGETGQEGFLSKWGFLHIGKSSDESFGAIDVFQRKNNNVGFRAQNSGTSGSNYGMILDTFGAGGGVNYGAYFGARLAGTNRALAIVDPPLASSNHALWITAAAQNYLKGAVGIGNEFTTAYKLQVNQDLNSSLNAILDVMAIERNPSGTPTTGFGVGYAFRGKSSTTNNQPMARITTEWETPTHATRAAKLKMLVSDFSGEKTVIEAGVTGASTPKIGFLGITPQPRLAISGDHKGNEITEQIVEALALFGLITDATTNTDAFVLTGETGNWPLLQSLVDGLTNYSPYFVDTTSTGDCNLVCEPIPPEFWCKEYDFTNESDRSAWEIVRGLGNANGFESTMSDEMVFVHTSAFEPFRVIQVTIFYSQSGIADATILFGAYDFIGYIAHDWGAVDAGTGLDVQIDFSPSYESFSGFRIVATSTDPAQQIRITGLKVFGYDEGIFGKIRLR